MLRLTRTAIGLLTAQYRSVLKKCWAINVGVFGLMGKAATGVAGGAVNAISGALTAFGVNVVDVLAMMRSLDGMLGIQRHPDVEHRGTEGSSDALGITSFLQNDWILRFVNTPLRMTGKGATLPAAVVVATVVATTILPSDAYAGYGIAVEGELDGYDEASIYSYYYAKYRRSNGRSNFLDVQTSDGAYFDLETFLVDLSEGRLFVHGAITTHDIRTGAVTSNEIARDTITTTEIANGAVTDAKIASGITASKITQNASYLFVNATEKAIWNGYSTTIAGKADKATTLSGYGITDAYTKTQVDNLISGSGSGSSYSAGTGIRISLADKVISLDSDYLDNNYYRKNKKSGILNGFEEWKKDDI